MIYSMPTKKRTPQPTLYSRVRRIIESARKNAVRSVNSSQVLAYWLIGQEIVQEEQRGKRRADYGEQLVVALSKRMTKELGTGFSVSNLKYMRQFFLAYEDFIQGRQIGHAGRDQFIRSQKSHAVRDQLSIAGPLQLFNEGAGWSPGRWHPDLSWTHYRILLKVEASNARKFYEIEAVANLWTARELERQINSLLFERLAMSRDKRGVKKLAAKGNIISQPKDLFKDPMIIEFLGLPEVPRIVESDIEQALITNLQTFLLELGRGFAFVSRQERLTVDGDHFYIDLVFYHTVLKCFVLIDLKTQKLSHQDLGQLQLYVNYFDCERRSPGDNPTLGLILCTDKNDAVVKYTLGSDQQQRIFASRYKLHLPTEAELRAELKRELRELAPDIRAASDKTRTPRRKK